MNPTMLSLQRSFNTIPSRISFPSSHHNHARSLTIIAPIRSSSSGGTSNGETINTDGGASSSIPPPITPPDTAGIRFRRGARRKRKQEDKAGGEPMKVEKTAASKNWESKTLTEKAVELYMGEKGLLFWLNKFAYASIFIIIGGWILFRFVGPALNLYQLDTPPLAPTSIFKGS